MFYFTVQLYWGGGGDTAAGVQTPINAQGYSVVKYMRTYVHVCRQSGTTLAKRHLHTQLQQIKITLSATVDLYASVAQRRLAVLAAVVSREASEPTES